MGMLVISRQRGEAFRLRDVETGSVIWVHILTNPRADGKVRLGISAPDGVEILRQELIRSEEPEKAN